MLNPRRISPNSRLGIDDRNREVHKSVAILKVELHQIINTSLGDQEQGKLFIRTVMVNKLRDSDTLTKKPVLARTTDPVMGAKKQNKTVSSASKPQYKSNKNITYR